MVLPNYGVPDSTVSFGHNDLVVEAAATDGRIRATLWVSPLPRDAERTAAALALAGERGVRALKLSFLLGGRADDPACAPALDAIFATARQHRLVVHVHTSPGAGSDIDAVGGLVDRYAEEARLHLVHFGGGVSGHIKLAGGRFLDWVAAGKQVYTDLSWSVGFAPRWLVAEVERRGLGHDRVLFASDEPWSDRPGELAKLAGAVGDGELARLVFTELIRRGVYPFVVPFRPLAGTLAAAEPPPASAMLTDVTARVAALLQAAGMRGVDQGAGCAACGACGLLRASGG